MAKTQVECDRDRRSRFKAAGGCQICGEPPAIGRTYCQAHLNVKYAQNQRHAQKMRKRGACARCGKELADHWRYKCCLGCLEKRNAR